MHPVMSIRATGIESVMFGKQKTELVASEEDIDD